MLTKKKKGFTLSELLVVIIVVAVLSAVAIPMYTKAVSRSRASDALKVLSVASAKQEAYFIDNGEYATNFGQLSAPVKGLTGSGNVTVGKFDYAMSDGCMVASYPNASNPKYTIYKNFQTQQDGCVGDGCSALMDIIPTMGSVGCDLEAFGKGDGNTVNDDFCAKNPGLCGTGDPNSGGNCPKGKVYNPSTGSCVCSAVCSNGATQNPTTCACSCPSSCSVQGAVMDKTTCACSCPSDKPYIYDGKCNSCRQGSAMGANGQCCPVDHCYDASSGICRPDSDVCAGVSTQKQSCGGGYGIQTRTMQAGCPRTWSAWSSCECQGSTKMQNGICVRQDACQTGTSRSCGTCGKQSCTNGQWGVCKETEKPFLTEEGESCGKCGKVEKSLSCNKATATWETVKTCVNEKGTCALGSANCTSSCECAAGYEWSGSACVATLKVCTANAVRSCGTCGTQTCNADGSAWNACSEKNRPLALPQNCGTCGTQTNTYSCVKTSTSASWVTKTGACVDPVKPETSQTCGGNGTQTRSVTCGTPVGGIYGNRQWITGEWGACECPIGYTLNAFGICELSPTGPIVNGKCPTQGQSCWSNAGGNGVWVTIDIKGTCCCETASVKCQRSTITDGYEPGGGLINDPGFGGGGLGSLFP